MTIRPRRVGRGGLRARLAVSLAIAALGATALPAAASADAPGDGVVFFWVNRDRVGEKLMMNTGWQDSRDADLGSDYYKVDHNYCWWWHCETATWDNAISFLRISPNTTAVLYEMPDFDGSCVSIRNPGSGAFRSVPLRPEYNDWASSLYVLYGHPEQIPSNCRPL